MQTITIQILGMLAVVLVLQSCSEQSSFASSSGQECTNISNDKARLACYDAIFNANDKSSAEDTISVDAAFEKFKSLAEKTTRDATTFYEHKACIFNSYYIYSRGNQGMASSFDLRNVDLEKSKTSDTYKGPKIDVVLYRNNFGTDYWLGSCGKNMDIHAFKQKVSSMKMEDNNSYCNVEEERELTVNIHKESRVDMPEIGEAFFQLVKACKSS